MFPSRPPLTRPPQGMPVPFGDADGAVITHAGRYARECVLLAFEMIGGVERMADWANKNPGDFYTKLYPKVITKEIEVHTSETVEDLLARLDGAQSPYRGEAEPEPIDADYEIAE